MKHTKWSRTLIGVSLAALLFTGCTKESITDNTKNPDQDETKTETDNEQKTDTTPVQGGQVKIGLLTPIEINLLGISPASQGPLESVYRGLLNWDDTLKPVPDLTEDFKVNEEAKSITFKINGAAKWHDGKPITAEDVIFTYSTYAHPHYYGIWREGIEAFTGVSEVRSFRKESISGMTFDEATGLITIQLSEITPEINSLLTAPLLPSHVLKGKSIEEMDKLAKEGKVPGNGAYQIKTVAEGSLTLGKASGANAYLDEVSFVTIKEENAKDSGSDLDLMQASPGLVKTFESDDAWKVIDAPGLGYHYLGINNRNELFKDSKVRQALALLIDKDSYIKEVLANAGQPALTPVPSQSWAFASNLTANQASTDEAKKLLTEAGWDFNKEVSLRYVKDHPVWEKAAKHVEARLTEAGIKIKLEPTDQKTFVPYLFSGKPFDLFLYAWRDERDLSHLNEQWESDEIDQGLNVVGYSNTQADQLISEAAATLDAEARKKAYDAWQQTFMADAPIVPIARPSQLFIAKDTVKGIDAKNSDFFEAITEWWKQN